MNHLLLFAALQLGCSAYAIWRGGQPERIVGIAQLVAYGATIASYSALHVRFRGVEYGPLIVDIALLALLVGVALRADRFWPIVLAALQLDSLFAHLLKLADADLIRVTYALMIAVWSYPMALLLAIGTFRHRQRLQRNGVDRDWSAPRLTPRRPRRDIVRRIMSGG